MDRRTLLKGCGAMLLGTPLLWDTLCGCSRSGGDTTGMIDMGLDGVTAATFFTKGPKLEKIPRREGEYYTKLDGGRVRCDVCPWLCELGEGERARCLIRANEGGKVQSLGYGVVCQAVRVPPQWLPIGWGLIDRPSLFLGHVGCNFQCDFCLTSHFAFAKPEDVPAEVVSPERVVAMAVEQNCRVIGFTTTEATVNFEYVRDVFKEAQAKGVFTHLLTNGFIQPGPLDELLAHTDSVQVGLKGMDEEFYETHIRGRLAPVLETLKRIPGKVPYASVGYVVIPGLNAAQSTVERVFQWVFEHLGPDTYLELYRYVPQHRLARIPPTEKSQLAAIADYCRGLGFRYVLVADFIERTNTSALPCYNCKKTLIERLADGSVKHIIKDGKCGSCGVPVRLPS